MGGGKTACVVLVCFFCLYGDGYVLYGVCMMSSTGVGRLLSDPVVTSITSLHGVVMPSVSNRHRCVLEYCSFEYCSSEYHRALHSSIVLLGVRRLVDVKEEVRLRLRER